MTATSIEQTFKANHAEVRKRLGFMPTKSINMVAEIERQIATQRREARRAWERQQEEAKAKAEAERRFQERMNSIDVSGIVISGIAQGSFMQAGASQIEIPKLTMQQIAEQVLRYHRDITLADIRGESRIRPVMLARRDLIVTIKRYRPEISNCAIGRFVNKDHSSVYHSIRKHREQSQ